MDQSRRTNLGLQIAVFDNGFVFVGQTYLVSDDSGEWVEMLTAYNVRRYGTTRGLPQLATEGPQPETQLDSIAGLLKCVRARLNFFMECKREAWQKIYPE